MNNLDNIIIDVERAINELRLGQPITIFENGEGLLIQAIEGINEDSLAKTSTSMQGQLFLTLTKQRAQSLYPHENISQAIKIPLGKLELPEILSLSALTHDNTSRNPPYSNAENNSSIALELIKYAQLIPALLVAKIDDNQHDLYSLTFSSIESYQDAIAHNLKPICTAPLTLRNAENAAITIFRATPSSKEHYAITVGDPKKAPLVRIHSSCFTGDLLGSLKCDCGEQLQDSLLYMSENGGGIILYMQQEGRNIGFANKIRTYELQSNGLNTVEANEFLGFADDERPYLPAANMLKQLGFTTIKLMTNNPRKLQAMEQHNIKIIDRVPLIIPPHQHNDEYMQTKFSKLGHLQHEQ